MVDPRYGSKFFDNTEIEAETDLWRRVAAQVHWEQITLAIRPVFTVRPAVLKCSEVAVAPAKRHSSQMRPEVMMEKITPKRMTMA